MRVDKFDTHIHGVSGLEMALALTDLLSHAPVRVALFDSNMCYLASSRLWNETYLPGVQDPRGLSHYDLMPNQPRHWRKFHVLGLQGHATSRKYDKWLDEAGNPNYLNWSLAPWRDHNGNVGGILIVTEEVTDQWLAHEAVQESQERFELAVRATSNGIYDWNLVTGQMYWSPVLCEMLGLPAHFEATQQFWRSVVDPDDLARISRELETAVKNRSIEYYTTRYRIRHADGHMVPTLARSVLKRDHNGRVVRLVGANVDLSKICIGPANAASPVGDSGPKVVDLLQEASNIAGNLESLTLRGEGAGLVRQLNGKLQVLIKVFNGSV